MFPATLSPPPAARAPAPPAADRIGLHAARIAAWLTRGGTDPPADPARVLRGRGYLSPTLLAAAAEAGIDPAAFAVCAFPCKATGRRDPAARLVGDAELRLRVAAFAEVAANPDRATLRAAGRLADLSDSEADALAADLTGTPDPAAGYLHLATLTNEQAARVAATWRAERDVVQFVRTTILTPPSRLAVSGDLATLCPDVPPAVLVAATELERDARGAASRVLAPGRVADAVVDFWDHVVRDRLRSGFPYFAFRSRFRTWWNQCLLTHPWERPPAGLAVEPAARSDIDAELDLLRACREVFRVVRTTFFVRSASDPAGGTAEYRRAVDAVWARRLEPAADGRTAEPFEAIRAGFPWLTPAAANNLSHRVRMRVLAGVKARVDRWRTGEILGLTTPARLRDEPAVPTVAAVCRAALPGETLLGAFAAHAWLGGAVRPRHAGPLTLPDFVAELRHWLDAAGFREAVRRGAAGGSRTDALLDELHDRPVGIAVRTPAAAAGQSLSDAAKAVSDRLLGPAGAPPAERLRAWARLAGHEWVLPAWFLAAVDRRPLAWVLARLLPDDDAAAAVERVARDAGGTP